MMEDGKCRFEFAEIVMNRGFSLKRSQCSGVIPIQFDTNQILDCQADRV